MRRNIDRILFECKTFYHLINIINIKLSLFPEKEADLILTNDTDFSSIYESIVLSNIFKNVYCLEYAGSVYGREFGKLPEYKRMQYFKNPLSFVEHVEFEPNVRYTDYYIGLDDDYTKLFYYALIHLKMSPKVHIFDEGSASYAMDYVSRIRLDGMIHSDYKERSYPRNIVELLLNDDTLYSGPSNFSFPIHSIPKVGDNPVVIKALRDIWGEYTLPAQRYVYLEGGTFADGTYTEDYELVLQVADLVGKDNLIVKLHSRTKYDRFSPRGISVVPYSTVPWEIYMLSENFEKKILISNVSTASLTPQIMFGYNTRSIHLQHLLPLDNSLIIRQKYFKNMYQKMLQRYNENGIQFYCPHCMQELSEIIKYLEGEYEHG